MRQKNIKGSGKDDSMTVRPPIISTCKAVNAVYIVANLFRTPAILVTFLDFPNPNDFRLYQFHSRRVVYLSCISLPDVLLPLPVSIGRNLNSSANKVARPGFPTREGHLVRCLMCKRSMAVKPILIESRFPLSMNTLHSAAVVRNELIRPMEKSM